MFPEEPIRKTLVRKLILIAAVCTPLGVLFLMYLHSRFRQVALHH